MTTMEPDHIDTTLDAGRLWTPEQLADACDRARANPHAIHITITWTDTPARRRARRRRQLHLTLITVMSSIGVIGVAWSSGPIAATAMAAAATAMIITWVTTVVRAEHR